MPGMMSFSSLGLYIHIPWCIQKCPYCDFNSHALKGVLPEAEYVETLLYDLAQDVPLLNGARTISSVFIGGGTPSLFSPEALADLLAGVQAHIPFSDDVEITLEANPGTFESVKFAEFHALGINRLSIGIQSFQDRHLKHLGRVHNGNEARAAIDMARRAGFENINLDLMFGLPEQTEGDAVADIQTALAFSPSHLSFYQLTLEPNTLFHRYPPALPDDDSIYSLQKQCQQHVAAAGFQQYEISAYSLPGKACRHNLNYWQFGDYLGIGAGAHGKITQALPDKIVRTQKLKNPRQYQRGADIRHMQTIEKDALALEFMMNQLRLKQGFQWAAFSARTGLSPQVLEPELSCCIAEGLLAMTDERVFCTEKGWDFLDAILERFV